MGGERGRRNREIFEQFFAQDCRRLVGAVALILGDEEVAKEAVDEAVARAWNRVRRGHEIEPLGAWVRVVALNIGYSHHRRRAIERKYLSRIAPSPDRVDQLAWSVSVDVRAALAALPRRQREVAVLHYMCDLPIATIADELHLSVGGVKSALEKARAALKSVLGDKAQPQEVIAGA